MFCCTVRYSLSESTVFLVGEYGIPCRRVRYSLSESTVFLVGEYGIALRMLLREIIAAFAGLLSNLLSEPGRSAPRGGANLSESTVFFVGEYGIFCRRVRYFLSESTVFFVGEYGIDLLAGTVLKGTGRGSRSCRRVRYSSETLACLLKRYLWENPRSLRRSETLETRHEKTPLYSNSRESHLLGTPVVLVGHPGSGFCARIARLRCARDAGVAGASDTGRL
jgi:hypothetical protein